MHPTIVFRFGQWHHDCPVVPPSGLTPNRWHYEAALGSWVVVGGGGAWIVPVTRCRRCGLFLESPSNFSRQPVR